MPGRLFLCATPIGNLEDASPRLARTLREADVIYAEDTRRTAKLLAALGVTGELRSYFVGNERRRTADIAADLAAGRDVALVTDAGSPAVSDPGASAVEAARRVQAEVVVVPGPSAVVAAVMGSGMVDGRFVFEGFLERRGRDRSRQLERIATGDAPTVLFLSPHRAAADAEALAEALTDLGIEVNVLNAKNDAEEARIIAEAGDLGRVTVSTQMAGRGTDIRLGGADQSDHDAVAELGGLAVIGTSRHRTARLDNQLRGRAGRQGDPGLSLFFVSLQDDVVTSGGAGENVTARPEPDGSINSDRIRDWVGHCQRVTEGQLLEIHAQTWKYNQLLADQRDIIEERRARLLDTDQAWVELSERAPEVEPAEDHIQQARDIMLFHLDDEWAEHLAVMADVRESIHLRAIARETPIDEYHRIAVREFKDLAQRAVDKAVETFRAGGTLEDLGLARPSATWTYMVSDNPLAGSGNSAISGIGNLFR